MLNWSFVLIILVCTASGTPELINEREKLRTFDAKSMLSSLASSLMSRGYLGGAGSSQALIFAAGSIGAGTWKGGYARSDDGDERIVTDEELLLFLSYLSGYPGKNGCLQNIACQDPEQAKKYVAAGDLLLKITRMLTLDDPDIKYNYVLKELQEAVKFGESRGNCNKYVCGS